MQQNFNFLLDFCFNDSPFVWVNRQLKMKTHLEKERYLLKKKSEEKHLEL